MDEINVRPNGPAILAAVNQLLVIGEAFAPVQTEEVLAADAARRLAPKAKHDMNRMSELLKTYVHRTRYMEPKTCRRDFVQAARYMVTSVYSGKVGCMCGCNGTYRYASNVDRVREEARRGYPLTAEEISDAQVTRVLGRLFDAARDDAGLEFDEEDGEWITVDQGTSRIAVYLRGAV